MVLGDDNPNSLSSPANNTRSNKKRSRQQDEDAPKENMTSRSPKKTRKNSLGGPQPSQAAASPAPQTDSMGPVVVPPASGFVTEDYMSRMEDRLTGLFTSRLGMIENHVQNNSRQIEDMKKALDEREAKMEARLTLKINRAVVSGERKLRAGHDRSADTLPVLTDKQEESYLYHRRTLRIWPIPGPDRVKNTQDFIQTKLKITGSEYDAIGRFEAKEEKMSGSNYPDEVVVVFETREARDRVKGASRNLANDPQAGIRINVPGFLLDNYRLLAATGYSIKTNQAGVKRSIKFDDPSRNLVLDVLVGEEWRRITPQEARLAAATNPNIKLGPKKMSGADISSLVGQPLALPAPAAVPGRSASSSGGSNINNNNNNSTNKTPQQQDVSMKTVTID